MLFEFGTYDIDVDVEKTRAFYDTARCISEGCSCEGCRNYMAAIDTFPREVKDFFDKLGVDLKCAAELMIPFSEDNGKTLNYWGGFYHICGELLNGYDYNAFEGEGIRNIDKTRFYHITDGFSVGFSNYADLLEDGFPEPVIQIEIEFLHIPWVLDEENPYVEKPRQKPNEFFKKMIEKRRKKEEMVLLLKMYARGEYDTASFCNMFCDFYGFENDARSVFSGKKKAALDDLSSVAERYTNIEEDLIKYPDSYYGEERVKESFETVKKVFNI